MKLLNIGIMAHVDAGKTTVTEQFLFTAGAIRKLGSVDKGTTWTDGMAVEKARGISVRLATASLEWQDVRINLIDTPGHVDFCAEVERSLRALDAAVLVVCAVEGVQAFTQTLFEALQSLQIPTLIFLNKLDRAGADPDAVLAELQRELSPAIVPFQKVSGLEDHTLCLYDLWQAGNAVSQDLLERVIETDERLLEHFFAGERLDLGALNNALRRAVAQQRVIPLLMGVAKTGLGIRELLDGLVRLLPTGPGKAEEPFSAIVFKIEHDKTLGKMAYLRLFSGQLQARDILQNTTRGCEEKVGQLKRVEKGRYRDLRVVSAGDIAVVSGLSQSQIGDVYGHEDGLPDAYTLSAPLLTVQVRPTKESDLSRLAQALGELAEEDPQLAVAWLPEQRELHLNITGWIQIEILEAVLEERYGLAVAFDEPSVIYKETPTGVAEGYERYWMPKPCWAIMRLLIEPGERGSGLVYESKVSVDHVAMRYQNEIKNTMGKALKQGIKGWEVTDLKITLIEGEDHQVHTRPGDFITATPMAVMNGLMACGTTLLEPILSFSITAPLDMLGNITSDITKMRGRFETPEIVEERFSLKGCFPLATSVDYAVQLASRSGGKAKIMTRLETYEACLDVEGKVIAYRGVSPLDREAWILQARGAIRS